jgi:hypothetical protein
MINWNLLNSIYFISFHRVVILRSKLVDKHPRHLKVYSVMITSPYLLE